MRKRSVCLSHSNRYHELNVFGSAEKAAAGDKGKHAKDGEELEQVAGNAEDEIGERIAAVRESELLYGPNSLLAVFGPMLVHICGSPHKYKVQLLYCIIQPL